MTDDFKKALAEFNNQGDDIYKEGINEGAWWAYEWMCDVNHQFALHRRWVDKHEALTKEAEALAYCLENHFCEEQIEDGLARWRKFRGEK